MVVASSGSTGIFSIYLSSSYKVIEIWSPSGFVNRASVSSTSIYSYSNVRRDVTLVVLSERL